MGTLLYLVRRLLRFVANVLRRVGRAPDYVTFSIEKAPPEIAAPRPPIPQRWLTSKQESLQDLGETLRHVAADRRVRGIVLHLRNLSEPLAQLQSLRDLIADVRHAGKHVVVWAPSYNLASYYVACAADEILLQPGGSLVLLGMTRTTAFLGEALERIGLEGQFVAISPYKTAADQLTRTRMSEEAREMIEWLVGDQFDQMVDGMATDRGVQKGDICDRIDAGIHLGEEAVEAGLVDAIRSEEELPTALGTGSRPARLTTYAAARRSLLRPAPRRGGRYVALLRVAGSIVDGRSSRPPLRSPFAIPFLLNERAGDLTVVAQARRVARDRRAAAVVVHVDSGGGSADASEAMSAALRIVAGRKPLVVSMGNLAASGGYYISTPAEHIIAQGGTVTGSIGVLFGKLVSTGIFEKLLIHRDTVERGAHARLFSDSHAFSDEERRLIHKMIVEIYDLFLTRVSESRRMEKAAVDAVGGGRVWTGRQALERGLIDELGGLDRAIACARARAELPDSAPVRLVEEPKRPIAPTVYRPPSALEYALDGLRPLLHASVCLVSPIGSWDS